MVSAAVSIRQVLYDFIPLCQRSGENVNGPSVTLTLDSRREFFVGAAPVPAIDAGERGGVYRPVATVAGTTPPRGAHSTYGKGRTPMTILSQLTAVGTIGALLLAILAILTVVYVFSADPGRRARALRVMRLLLRR